MVSDVFETAINVIFKDSKAFATRLICGSKYNSFKMYVVTLLDTSSRHGLIAMTAALCAALGSLGMR